MHFCFELFHVFPIGSTILKFMTWCLKFCYVLNGIGLSEWSIVVVTISRSNDVVGGGRVDSMVGELTKGTNVVCGLSTGSQGRSKI